MTHRILHALQATQPNGLFTVTSSRDWFSMTFSGQRLTIKCVMPDDGSAEKFADGLVDQEFSLPNMLVADIAVSAIGRDADNVEMTIEALLLQA